jgi:hypothetical protein
MGGDPGQVHRPSLYLDEEQHVQPRQADDLHCEEVRRQQPAGLTAQELCPTRAAPPRPAAAPAETVPAQNPRCIWTPPLTWGQRPLVATW